MARNPAQQTVKRYLESYRSMIDPWKVRHHPDSQSHMNYLKAKLREARIIHMPMQTFAHLYHLVDVWTVEAITGEQWLPGGQPARPDDDERARNYMRLVQEH